jgi:hypothetical protein
MLMIDAGPTFFGANLKGRILLKKTFSIGCINGSARAYFFKKRGGIFSEKKRKQ